MTDASDPSVIIGHAQSLIDEERWRDARVLDPHNVLPRLKAKELRQLSPSKLGDADICWRRLGYKFVPDIPRMTGEARIVGTAYHAGLEDYYRHRMAFGDEHPEYLRDALLCAESAFCREEPMLTGDWETSRQEALERAQGMVTAYFAGGHQWPLEYKVLGVEQMIALPLNERWAFKLVLDLVLEGPGGVIIDDHKSAGRKWPKDKEHARKNQQAVIYDWAWWMATGVIPSAVYFSVMTYKAEFDRRISMPTSDHMAEVLRKANTVTQMLDIVPPDQLPTNPSSNLCSAKYCDFWNMCPAGAALL